MGGHGWGTVSRDHSVRAVNTALDQGINFFDTADIYGLGEGERILGEALGERRDEAIIASKFGVRVADGGTFYDNSPTRIRSALEKSLRRLGTDHIDLYQIHYLDGRTPLDDVVAALQDLRDRGLVRWFGLSNVSRDETRAIRDVGETFVSFQNAYSLADRSNEHEIRSLTAGSALTPMTWGSLGQGILTGKYASSSSFGPNDRRTRTVYRNFHGAGLEHSLRVVETLRQIAAEVGRSVPAVAIRWILDTLDGSVAIVGMKNVHQVMSNLEAFGWSLPVEAHNVLNDVSASREAIA